MNDFPAWAGTVPGWITASGTVTMLGLWFKYLTSRRAQDGDRLTDLETENRQLRRDFDAYRKSCIEETDLLRREIGSLRDEIRERK